MLAAVVFVPSAPLLVPELAGPSAFDTEPVRSAVRDALADVASTGIDRWVAVGASDAPVTGPVEESGSGSFARFGVDVRVGVSDRTGPRMSLSALIGAWLRQWASLGPTSTWIVGRETPPAECAAIGADLAARLGESAERIGLLVVGDGSTALTPKAPGGGRRDSAVALNDSIVAAIGAADIAALLDLEAAPCNTEGVGGRVAWQVAAAAVESCGSGVVAKTSYADAPFGVGYVVATWTVSGDRS
ncbi:hypothetical protein [Gordonia rubripertincta]|uniref:hypothetical protein n=1 Tax=Gordonia rubripertincta TaxID=36822 RepID=UPI0015F9BFD7|nr:hypothetical protein [Gordonia rubripertincta]QMU19523.1 hypothetical protein H3V45_15740 [Gordonia rubripertincta]